MQEGLAAQIHTVVCYLAPAATALVPFQGPNAPPAHPLLAHVYGTKNIYSGVIRLYAAYNLTSSPHLYDLALWSLIGVLWLYGMECGVYGTVKVREALWPLTFSTVGITWMVMQRDFYLGAAVSP